MLVRQQVRSRTQVALGLVELRLLGWVFICSVVLNRRVHVPHRRKIDAPLKAMMLACSRAMCVRSQHLGERGVTMGNGNLRELMTTLDDSWNAQDLDTFSERHTTDTTVRWPGQPPTHGIEAHRLEAMDFFRAFPDQHLDNHPYKVLIADGDWTCSVARFTGTMTGPMKGPDGKEIPPTGKSFEVDFCTVARWHDNQIVEENLFYDLDSFMHQIGLSD